MLVLYLFIIFFYSTTKVENKDIIVERPFYLRGRIYESHAASIQFEIPHANQQRTCHMYKFTIQRNRERPYSMPEQNLTFWSNSLELKHLPAGHYNVCAIICSEYFDQAKYHHQQYPKKNRTKPIEACIDFKVFRSHLLILTLYILVIVFLIISQIIFSIHKRRFQARVKMALIEADKMLEKQLSSSSTDRTQSLTFLQSLVTLPIIPVEHPVPPDEQHPVTFHLGTSNEH